MFNALCENGKAEVANYPFCTIEPNVGIVAVPDERLEVSIMFAPTYLCLFHSSFKLCLLPSHTLYRHFLMRSSCTF